VSEASPATGATGAETEGGRGARRKRRDDPAEDTTVSLEHARWRAFGWALAGLVVGSVLVWKLGAVGKGVGVLLLLAAALPARGFVLTLMHAPGDIVINGREVILPRGLCRAGAVTVPVSGLRHAYFLRRAVPWMRTGPLLVVETERGVFEYPRDWFASDADQRRVASAINHRLGR
jgi:hypothetical protein